MFKLPFQIFKKIQKINPVVLLILDGFGQAPPSSGNAIALAKTPFVHHLIENYPHTELIAAGESVGLPANEVGNTEVGHLTIGAGRVIMQDLERINKSIEKGSFYDNRAFLQAVAHSKSANSNMHILGLVGSGNVHSSLNHLYAFLQFCKKEQFNNVFLHLFTDGRDSPPKEGIDIIKNIEERLKLMNIGKIASISGRYFAMDRDRRWERTEKAYKCICMGKGNESFSALNIMESAYAKGQTDEFVEPSLVVDDGKPVGIINDNDSVVFLNFRVDRPKQLTMALILPDFEKLRSFDFGYESDNNLRIGSVEIANTFEREKILKNIFLVTMTEYHRDLKVGAIAFAPEKVEKSLCLTISTHNFTQIHLSESEKERFIKYYLNGMNEDPFPGEEDVIIPSPKVPTYDLKPEMSLPKLTKSIVSAIKKGKYNFVAVNIANPDMVAHSGNLKATIKAIEAVDTHLKIIVEEVLKRSGSVLITADHGNAEELITYPQKSFYFTTEKGSKNTDHSNNPVPIIFVDGRFKGNPVFLKKGSLADIAPTILSLLKIPIPSEMTGCNLIKQLGISDTENELVSSSRSLNPRQTRLNVNSG